MQLSNGRLMRLGLGVYAPSRTFHDPNRPLPLETADSGLTLTKTSLVNGTQYRARVRARTEAGWGPYSEYSAPFTPG